MEEEEEKENQITGYPNVIPFNCTKEIIHQMEKNICKIKVGPIQGTGFFCKIPFPNEKNVLKVLITNNHIINEDILYKKDQIISIYIKEKKKIKELNLNDRIKYTKNKEEYDITIIELKEEDDINDYLELDDKIINDIINSENENVEFIDKTHYIIQYPEGELSVSYGIILNIYNDKEYKFNHKCNTKTGSSGSPILTLNNKVIGIHTGGNKFNKIYNIGTFLNYPIKDFINQYHKNNNKDIIDYKINEILLKEINHKFNANIKNTNKLDYTSLKKYMKNDIINEMKELALYYKIKITLQILNFNFHKKTIEQMETNVCSIRLENSCVGTGFFCKIPFPDKNNMLKVLITTNIFISEYILYKKDENINLIINNNKIYKLNLNDRIKYTTSNEGVTIIELKEEDGIKNYLELDDKLINDIINNKSKTEQFEDYIIYTILYNFRIFYEKNPKLQILYGKLLYIYKDRKYYFFHNCQTRGGTTGSPILNLNNKVIGVNNHVPFGKRYENGVFSFGTFLNYPIKEFIQLKFYNNEKIKEMTTKINYNKNNITSKERLNEKFSLIEKNFGQKIFKELNKLYFDILIEFEFYQIVEKEKKIILGLNSGNFYNLITKTNYIIENCIYKIKLGNKRSIGCFFEIPLPNKGKLFPIFITFSDEWDDNWKKY